MAYISNSRRWTTTQPSSSPAASSVVSPSAKPKAIISVCDPDVPSDIDDTTVTEAIGEPAKKSKIKEPLPSSVINERTMEFRMDSRTLWTKYALGLVNYAVSDVAELDTTPSVESRVSKASTMVGDYFIPYYGIRAGTEIGNMLTDIFNTGIEVVRVTKEGGDLVELKEQWDRETTALAQLFNELNPGQYPKLLIKEMLEALTKLWADNIKARVTKNVILNAESIDGINKLVITGIANHVNKGYQSLADVLSRGVIAQYPLLFLE